MDDKSREGLACLISGALLIAFVVTLVGAVVVPHFEIDRCQYDELTAMLDEDHASVNEEVQIAMQDNCVTNSEFRLIMLVRNKVLNQAARQRTWYWPFTSTMTATGLPPHFTA